MDSDPDPELGSDSQDRVIAVVVKFGGGDRCAVLDSRARGESTSISLRHEAPTHLLPV